MSGEDEMKEDANCICPETVVLINNIKMANNLNLQSDKKIGFEYFFGPRNVVVVNVEDLFRDLMVDWMNPKPGQFYELPSKYDDFIKTKGQNLFKVLFDIINERRYKIYRHVVLWLLYQFLFELGKENYLKNKYCSDRIEELKSLIFECGDLELKFRGIKVLGVFWLISCAKNEEPEEFKEIIEQIRVENKEKGDISAEFVEVSEETMHFFDMCLLLKKARNSPKDFNEKFEKYLSDSKNNFGDYMPVATGHNVQLLSFLAQEEMIYATVNFIAEKAPFRKGSTILSVFNLNNVMTGFNAHKFKSPQLEFLVSDRYKSIINSLTDVIPKLQKLLASSKTSTNKKLKSSIEDPSGVLMTSPVEDFTCFLFKRTLNVRFETQEESLFEKILETPGSGDLIRLIWSKTKASTRSTLSDMNNCNRKYLLEYVIKSDDVGNLLAFLAPCIDETSLTVPKVSLRFLNRQYINLTGKSLISRFAEVCQNQSPKTERVINRIFESKIGENTFCSEFFKIVLCILEDGRLILDMKKMDIPFDDLLELAKDPNETANLLTCIEDRKARKICQDKFENIREEIDILLGSIIAFWSKEDDHYGSYKEKLLVEHQFKPFFTILLSIIDRDEIQVFATKFVENFDRIENVFVKRYGRDSRDKRPRQYFLGLIILAAISNDSEKIIEFVLKREPVQNIKLFFPPNMRRNDTTNFFALKMLENGYDFGRKEFPLLWITSKQFEEFLNTRMKYMRTDVIEVDCRFMTHFHVLAHSIGNEAEVKWEDTKSLEYILENHSLHEYMEHPSIATYIDLKMHGFRGIYWGNFWFFALLIALPFGLLVMTFFSESDPGSLAVISWMCVGSIVILTCRELFQLFVVEDRFRDYIKQYSNILEVGLVLVETTTLVGILGITLFGDMDHMKTHYESYVMLTKFSSVTLMLLFTVDLLATLQNAAMPFYFILLRRVAATFTKFLGTFMVFLITFTISFMVFFGVEDVANEGRDEIFGNFVKFHKAFTKTILMLSGEYSIEPFILTAPELILFFVFVITTFILFNLILALTIDDVQHLKREARAKILQQNAESIITTSSFFLKMLDKSYALRQHHIRLFQYKHLVGLIVKRAEAPVKKYLLHRGDRIFINSRTREVTLSRDGEQTEAKKSRISRIGDFISGIFVKRTFVMEREDFEEVKKLVSPVNQQFTRTIRKMKSLAAWQVVADNVKATDRQ